MALEPTAQPRTLAANVRSAQAQGAATEATSASDALARALTLAMTAGLALDWALPLRGALSYALLTALSALTLPWGILVVRSRAQRLPVAPLEPSPRRQTSRRAALARFGLVLLFLFFLAAKWLVVVRGMGAADEYVGSSRSYSLALGALLLLGLASRSLHSHPFVASVAEHPARLLALSFGGTGLLGALILSLPVSLESVSRLSLIDNVFMAFSAVCITGLAVHNVAETYSLFGQVVLCALIQVGGLGIMVLSAAVMILAGQRLRVKSSAVMTQIVDGASLATLQRTVLTICVYTLVLEALGAMLLYRQFSAHAELALRSGHPLAGAGSPLWAAVFHSVSAFSNAGFSNLQGGLFPFAEKPLVLGTLTLLIVLGGVGFPVLQELSLRAVDKLRRRRSPALTLHTRITLRVSAGLLALMTVGYVVLEWNQSMQALSPGSRVMAGVFQSAAARTAGFNVVDLAAMRPATLVLTCAAMFIGAAPGSTGGGIKVTTFAVLLSGLRAELSARVPRLLNRTIPDSVVRKAIGVAFLSTTVVVSAFFALLLLEPHPPLDVLFEVVSAFSTTGLSTGITPRLSTGGKLLIVLLMFVGRVGPLTLAVALAVQARSRAVQLPEERVLIG